MPTPRVGETRDHFLSRCIPEVVGEGKPQDVAVAQCISLWENRDKMFGNKDEFKSDAFTDAMGGKASHPVGGDPCNRPGMSAAARRRCRERRG